MGGEKSFKKKREEKETRIRGDRKGWEGCARDRTIQKEHLEKEESLTTKIDPFI